MNYTLPTVLEVGGTLYGIDTDYRTALEAIEALEDPDLTNEEKAVAAIYNVYDDPDAVVTANISEALERCVWYLNGGEEGERRKGPRLMDWQQDFGLIASPVSRVMGRDIRQPEPLHWWTFLSAYQEIGDCLFAQVVAIREKLARGKKLDKSEREWYNRNRRLVTLRQKFSQRDNDALSVWTGGK